MNRYALLFDMDETLWHNIRYGERLVMRRLPGQVGTGKGELTSWQKDNKSSGTYRAWTVTDYAGLPSLPPQPLGTFGHNRAVGGEIWGLAGDAMKELIDVLNRCVPFLNKFILDFVIAHGEWHPQAVKYFFRDYLGASDLLLWNIHILNSTHIDGDYLGITVSDNKAETLDRYMQHWYMEQVTEVPGRKHRADHSSTLTGF